LIAFEDLNIQGMVKNQHLVKSIADRRLEDDGSIRGLKGKMATMKKTSSRN
jgi:hypothetical protein